MNIHKIIGSIHLWLGLFSGVVVFVIAITGCLYAFKTEIEDITQPYRFIEAKEGKVLSPSAIKQIAEEEIPGHHAHSVTYSNTGRSSTVIFYDPDPLFYHAVYVDPYSGEVLKVDNLLEGFFRFVLDGHFYFWLPPEIGQPLVASFTLVFVFMLISGIILWWPKNRKGRKKKFRIKWKARWRRKNYDLHSVIGFYISWLVIIFAITGLMWGFEWFENTSYFIASGGKEKPEFYLPQSDKDAIERNPEVPVVDQLWERIRNKYAYADAIEFHFPENSDAIEVAVNPDESTYYRRDFIYFDQFTLKEIEVDHIYGKYSNASVADKMIRMNYDIHVGAIGGLTGKVLAFLLSLLTASLPVTGFLVWWGRKKKDKKKLKKKGLQNLQAPVLT